MQRLKHNLIQGSAEWHAFRSTHFGASEASAMLGLSPYKTRDELLTEKKTGLTKEVNSVTQKIFDKGHAVEKIALPIAEKLTDVEFSPVTMSYGNLSASCDGLDFDDETAWENKQFNQAHYEQVLRGELPEIHWPQCQQVLYVTGAQRLFFTISDGTEEKTAGMWVYPDGALQQKIIAGWAQFAIDLENFVPQQKSVKVEAEAVKSLPVPSIVAKGELVASNMNEVTPYFDDYLKNVKTELATDEDFANGEANAKHCRESAKSLKNVAKAVIGQIVEINDAVSILEQYAAKFDAMGLRLEKAVKEQKEQIKTTAIMFAKSEYEKHVTSLENSCITLRNKLEYPNFAEAIKGVKTIDSMKSRLNDAVAKGKSEATQLANEVIGKLLYIKEAIKSYEHLFNPNELAFKDIEFIKLHIQSTKDAEDKRRNALAEAAAQKAIQEAEARAKKEAVDEPIEADPVLSVLEDQYQEEPAANVHTMRRAISAYDIVNAVASVFLISPIEAHKLIIEADFMDMTFEKAAA